MKIDLPQNMKYLCEDEEIIENNTVRWKLHGTPIKEMPDYVFDRNEYESVIAEIKKNCLK